MWQFYLNLYQERAEISRKGICSRCREEREDYKDNDQRHKHYSNMILGSSNDASWGKDTKPILIVAESHGGKRPEEFRDSYKDLKREMENLGNYYLRAKPITFHQLAMRYLLNILDQQSVPWIFTDLVKCFVSKNGKARQENWKSAIKNCSTLLDSQIDAISPSKILVLGNEVRSKYFGVRHNDWGEYDSPHGARITMEITDRQLKIPIQTLVLSHFPSNYTIDAFLADGWGAVIDSLLA